MADLPLEVRAAEALRLLRGVAGGLDPNRGPAAADLVIMDLVAALERREQQAEREMHHHIRLCAELGSLKRRITELRRTLGNVTTGIQGRNGAQLALDTDDAVRCRFEQKQRKAARHG